MRGNRLACLYHGWHFERTGRCGLIPAHPDLDPPATITAKTYGVAEAQGVIWVTPEGPPVPPGLPEGLDPLRVMIFEAPEAEVQAACASGPVTVLTNAIARAAPRPPSCRRGAIPRPCRGGARRNDGRLRPHELGLCVERWYAVADAAVLAGGGRKTVLLGREITVSGTREAPVVTDAHGQSYPTQFTFDHVWTTLGDAPRPLFAIPEGDEPGRTRVPCGVVRVRCSPLRAVENFLDIAHFPFVHTDILGTESHPEVVPYKVEIREDIDEVWATQVKFFQPQAAASAGDGIVTDYDYRVPAPTTAVLYKTCPPKPEAQDVIAIFVQPVSEEICEVWPWMALYDDETPYAGMVQFQQEIFLQDRSILENQRPVRLPLDPKMEIPTRADMTSVAYRRWLKGRGALYGAMTENA